MKEDYLKDKEKNKEKELLQSKPTGRKGEQKKKNKKKTLFKRRKILFFLLQFPLGGAHH